jgi:MFS family permease
VWVVLVRVGRSGAVTFGLGRYGYGLLLPDMQSELRMSTNAAGLISSGAYLSYLAANFLVVWLTTRFGPRWSVWVAPQGWPCRYGRVGMAVGAGAAAGLAFPPYADIVEHQVPHARRALAWSTISSGTGWGVAITGPIAIVSGHSWRLAWLVFVGLTIAAGSSGGAACSGTRRDHAPPSSAQLVLVRVSQVGPTARFGCADRSRQLGVVGVQH